MSLFRPIGVNVISCRGLDCARMSNISNPRKIDIVPKLHLRLCAVIVDGCNCFIETLNTLMHLPARHIQDSYESENIYLCPLFGRLTYNM